MYQRFSMKATKILKLRKLFVRSLLRFPLVHGMNHFTKHQSSVSPRKFREIPKALFVPYTKLNLQKSNKLCFAAEMCCSIFALAHRSIKLNREAIMSSMWLKKMNFPSINHGYASGLSVDNGFFFFNFSFALMAMSNEFMWFCCVQN